MHAVAILHACFSAALHKEPIHVHSQIYGNEAEVGQAVAASGIPRDELFLTSKIWIENLAADKLIPSLKESLRKLRTDYLDLTLVHWPSPKGARPAQ